MRFLKGLLLTVLAGMIFGTIAPSAANAGPNPVWLCKPGLSDNPCEPGLKTTVASPTGDPIRVRSVKADRNRKIDCFYVYPTVSDDPGANSDLVPDPVERSIALYQAARYSQHCRVFAPMYRQVTLTKFVTGEPITARMRQIAYNDVSRAWGTYLKKYNRGRGVVLIGHSQGANVLRRLIKHRIDRRPKVRRQLVSSILLGGNVLVPKKSGDRRSARRSGIGDFRHIRSCRSAKQLHCVVAFSTFNGPVPPDSLYGRAIGGYLGGNPDTERVLCVNPAALRGGKGSLTTIYPTEPYAPASTIGLITPAVGMPRVDFDTPWVEYRGAYRAKCSGADKADVLQIEALPGSPVLNPVPDPTWGLHLVDANLALGNLVGLVGREGKAFVRKRKKQLRQQKRKQHRRAKV